VEPSVLFRVSEDGYDTGRVVCDAFDVFVGRMQVLNVHEMMKLENKLNNVGKILFQGALPGPTSSVPSSAAPSSLRTFGGSKPC